MHGASPGSGGVATVAGQLGMEADRVIYHYVTNLQLNPKTAVGGAIQRRLCNPKTTGRRGHVVVLGLSSMTIRLNALPLDHASDVYRFLSSSFRG